MTDADRLAMSPELCDSIRVMAESDLGATDWPAETILRLLATIAALRAPTIAAGKLTYAAKLAARSAYEKATDYPYSDDALDAALEAALSTPSPTIAAPSPQDGHAEGCGFADEVTADWCPCRGPGSRWPKTEPSPSNEVTPEMVEAFGIQTNGILHGEFVRRGLEAALKARKPADDGAGQ